MQEISVHAFDEILQKHKADEQYDFINVCTPAEYKEKHILGVRSVPLDEIEQHLNEFADKKTIYVHCRSGNRARSAIEKLQKLGVTAELVNVSGGILAWDQAGLKTQSLTKRRPIMQQVLLTAGLIVILSHVLAYIVHPNFVYLSLFVGLGLTFSGLTGWCGMAYLLSKMPWNK